MALDLTRAPDGATLNRSLDWHSHGFVRIAQGEGGPS